jgi:hypothetical protein
MRDATMKRKLVIVKALEAIAMPLIVFLIVPQPDPITRATYDRIELGMTQEEVVALVGLPPGAYADNKATTIDECDFGGYQCKGTTEQFLDDPIAHWFWSTNNGTLAVGFDKNGKAFFKQFMPRPKPGNHWFDKVKAWLRVCPIRGRPAAQLRIIEYANPTIP